jgi:hypothetical protein
MLTKLVNENKTDWDEHLFTMLFSYKIAYKITTWYTLYRLMHGLHPLMPPKYIIPTVGRNERNNTLMKILTGRITKFKKLQEAKMQVVEIAGIQ